MTRLLPLAAVGIVAAGPAAHPNAKLLVAPADLKAGAVHVLDVRPQAAFEKGHVAGAVPVDPANWSKAILVGTADAAFWKRELAALGVTPGRPVVVVGDDARDYCRVWWMLRLAGVADARVLDGGFKGYAGPTATGTAKATPAAPHDWVPDLGRLATKTDLLTELRNPTGGIADARSAGEHTGADPLKNKRAGCVPGAVHLEWSELLDPATGRFLPADRIAKLMADRGVDLSKPQVTYCQGGGRAAVLAFGLELMGAKGVRNYYASWGEWGNAADTPVALPGKK
ncbi:MAG: rhodanese-like domain-containing protein [Gemmataceae bacterium]